MIKSRNYIILILVSVIYQLGISEAGDTEIWPIPTECPEVDPLEYTVHLQHESDCTKFYKCDHGEKVLFDCPEGLEFSPVLQVCVWPWEAECSLGDRTSTSAPPVQPPVNKDPDCPWPDPLNYTVHLPHENDCTKFYKCDNGVKVEFDCPDGLHFNKELEVCDWPQDAGCEDTATTTSTKRPKPPTTTTSKPTPPTNKDPDCPWPDPLNYTVHLPHETDCTKFYKCDNGVKVEFDCPDGLHFNKELEVCDWPWDAGCEEITTTSSTTTKSPTTKTTKPTRTTTAQPTPPPNRDPECPWPDPLNYTVHLPHETDCTKFYKCDNGIKVEFDCPDGLHFNKELEVCDWPWDAGCEEIVTTTSSTTTKTTKPTKTTTAQPTPPPNRDPECPWPDPLNYTVHLPHETDCTKFYKCDNGVKVEFDCPDGLHFNKELEVCDWPWDAGCEEIVTTTSSTTTKTTKPTKTTTAQPTPPPNRDPECPWPDPLNYTVHLPHETDCTKFYKCDNGVKVEFDCPDGLHFNKELEVCDWPWDAGCEEITTTSSTTTKSPTTKTTKPTRTTTAQPTPPPNRDPECPWPDPLNYTVHLPHETDCTKFYKCDNGIKVEFDCPDGLHFNKELEVCDWPWDAGCEEITTTSSTTTKSPTTKTTKPTRTTTAQPTPPPNRDPECPWPDPLNYTVHLPHETDCTKFYKCDNGIKVEFDCPDGLHFNKELEVCDWPWDAGCEEITTTSSTTTKSPTTKTTKPTKTTTAQPTPPPNRDPECPWPDPLNYTVHLPHETDCTKFYKCDNGIKVEFDCPDGLHFNKELEVCDWPWDAGCQEITITSPTTTQSTPSPNPCPNVECQDATIYLPVLSNARKYIRCVNGKEVTETCPGNLVFDERLATCNLEYLIEPIGHAYPDP